MNCLVAVALFLAAVSADEPQKITDFTGCVVDDKYLRLDCKFAGKFSGAPEYEFTVIPPNKAEEVLNSTKRNAQMTQRIKSKVTVQDQMVQLTVLSEFKGADLNGNYSCNLNPSSAATQDQKRMKEIRKDQVTTCSGIALFMHSTNWLLGLLLSLLVLHAAELVSL